MGEREEALKRMKGVEGEWTRVEERSSLAAKEGELQLLPSLKELIGILNERAD